MCVGLCVCGSFWFLVIMLGMGRLRILRHTFVLFVSFGIGAWTSDGREEEGGGGGVNAVVFLATIWE